LASYARDQSARGGKAAVAIGETDMTCSESQASAATKHDIMSQMMKVILERGRPLVESEFLINSDDNRMYNGHLTEEKQRPRWLALGELVARGYVVTVHSYNWQWPQVGLSDLGRAVAEAEDTALYQLDSYLARLSDAVPKLDQLARDYISEAVRAFGQGLYRSATVMVGAASEILILRLIESWADAIGGIDGTKLRKSASDDSVATAFERFKASFGRNKCRIDQGTFKQDMLVVIEQVFHFIRLCRNEAGHAIRVEPPDRPLLQANLIQYHFYARRLYDVMAYLPDPGLAAP
jgi:hypothetical protein